MHPYRLIRYIEYDQLFERFFVAAILSIIGIRLYLKVTGYPQLGGGGLHIAHMLWGGLLMVIALIGFMLFLNDDFKPFFAIIGGVGFGTFLDELGKFITNDNNYFFQPTFALIYLIFVTLFMLNRLHRRKHFSEAEYLANSLDKLKEVIISDLDKKEKALALDYLAKADPKHPLSQYLKKSFEDIADVPDEKLSVYERIKVHYHRFYATLKAQAWFMNVVAFLFVLRSLGHGATLVLILQGALSWYDEVQLVAILLQLAITLWGVWQMRTSRLGTYIHFKNATLISIFAIHAFNFYREPVWAFVSVIIDLIMLSALNFAIERERAARAASGLKKAKDTA